MATTMQKIPVVLTGLALQSLRDSGYSLPAAIGEVIDNSLEAQANRILVRLDEGANKGGKRHIHRIAIADDGTGMDVKTLHHYLQLGFSTRYMSRDTIGKYGVGAKLAALNYGKRIDVWSRQSTDTPWLHTFFDLAEALEDEERHEEIGLLPPAEAPVPDDLQDLLPDGSGTLVVWSDVDRLEEGRRAQDANELRVDLEKELSRIFRYFINGGIEIRVNGNALLPHDPLFLMEGTWADTVLSEHLNKQEQAEAGNGRKKSGKEHFPATLIEHKASIRISGSEAYVTVTLYPPEVLRKRLVGGDSLAKKLRVPDNQGAISFVRLNREIGYTNVPYSHPTAVTEADRFIGIEVSFKPDLDDFFGVRNVKRGVEPHGELRAKMRKVLAKAIAEAREKLQQHWGEVERRSSEREGEHSTITTAVKEADRTMPKGRAKGPEEESEKRRAFEELAEDLGKTDEKEKQDYYEKVKDLPFVVESVSFPGTVFLDIQHIDGQVIIRLNTRHRFYRDLWEPLKQMAEAPAGIISGADAVRTANRTIEALSLLIVAYGKAESMHENPREQYGDLRGYWGQFLETLMGKVKNVL